MELKTDSDLIPSARQDGESVFATVHGEIDLHNSPDLRGAFLHVATDARRFPEPLPMDRAREWAGDLWDALEVERIVPSASVVHRTLELMGRLGPLFVSKVNTSVQIALVGFVLARLGLGIDEGTVTGILIAAAALTTVLSGLSYLLRWTLILTRSERAW